MQRDGTIEAPGAEGDTIRAGVGREAYELNVQQFCCAGLNFGYFYDGSQLIAYDGEAAPRYSMGAFVASTVPGCWLPHSWLRDGRSLYDALGSDYTLLRTRKDVGVERLLSAAQARGVPMVLLDLDGEALPPEFRHRLLICRPDRHVAWRGDGAPADALALVDRLRAVAPA